MFINRVVLIGNLTRDPELKELKSGRNVCHLRLACNRLHREEDGAWGERPNYFDVSVFGNQAESVSRYLKKGRSVGVDGRLEWREWETADQQKRQAVSIVADSVQFLGAPTVPAGGSAAGAAGAGAAPGGDREVAGDGAPVAGDAGVGVGDGALADDAGGLDEGEPTPVTAAVAVDADAELTF